jgi:hypothetical protein
MNNFLESNILGCNAQYNIFQRISGVAPFVGCVFMIYNKSNFYLRILWQKLVNKEILVAANKFPKANEDKYATYVDCNI